MTLEPTPLRLVPLFELEVRTSSPIALAGGRAGDRVVIDVTGGSFSGARLSGRVLPSGGDWVRIGKQGLHLDVRLVLETSDEVPILFSYRGVAPRNVRPRWARVSGGFEAPRGNYEWLNIVHAVGLGQGGANMGRYQFYELG